jgi:hypothetical protein
MIPTDTHNYKWLYETGTMLYESCFQLLFMYNLDGIRASNDSIN